MKIVKLAVRNFLGISDFEAILGPGVNVVHGQNGSGKSSLLKAIWKAFFGGKSDAPWVIHRLKSGDVELGKGKAADFPEVAEILVELDGALKVRRRIAERGSFVQVTKKEGPIDVEITSPQKFLDALVPQGSLNPVEFFKASPAERRRILLAAVPATLTHEDIADILAEYTLPPQDWWKSFAPTRVGLTELGEIEILLMERRRAAWSEKEHHEEASKAEAKKLPPNYAAEDVPDVAAVLRRLDEANFSVQAHGDARDALSKAELARDAAQDTWKRLAQEMDNLKIKIASATIDIENAELKVDERQAFLDAKVSAVVDPEPIKATLRALEERREWRKAWDEAKLHEAERETFAAAVRAYDDAMRKGIRTEAPRLLWSRLDQTPLRGLDIGMDGDRITVKGTDIDNLSASEQIKIALAIARATAGELKTICVDGFEVLDTKTREAFRKEAAEDGYQYIIASVSEGPLTVTSKL